MTIKGTGRIRHTGDWDFIRARPIFDTPFDECRGAAETEYEYVPIASRVISSEKLHRTRDNRSRGTIANFVTRRRQDQACRIHSVECSDARLEFRIRYSDGKEENLIGPIDPSNQRTTASRCYREIVVYASSFFF
jgi:hypothetical protein